MIFQNYKLIRQAMIDTNFIHWYYVHKLFGKDICYVTTKDICNNILLGNIKISDVPDIYKDIICERIKRESEKNDISELSQTHILV